MSLILSHNFMSEEDLYKLDDFQNITGNLYMGSFPRGDAGVYNIPSSIKYVINVSQYSYSLPAPQQAFWVKLHDCDILPDKNMVHGLAELVCGLTKVGNVLVHCEAGLNRSGLIVALALMKGIHNHNPMEPQSAITLMRERRRPNVLFNKVFADWLLLGAPYEMD